MATIAIVDYGMGNLRSVAKAFLHVAPEHNVIVASSAAQIDAADRVVFPGQGAMRDCMAWLERSGLRQAVLRAAKSKPLFGVCVGEQMLFDWSQEGGEQGTAGLGILPGKVFKFDQSTAPMAELKVPHMGWNKVFIPAGVQKAHPIWHGLEDGTFFYFVHSFYAVVAPELSAGETDFGIRFTSAVAKDNIFATQFHPEKSASAGLTLYKNFVTWNP